MKTSVIKTLSNEHAAILACFPSISKNSSEKKIIEYITGCKYIVVCANDIYVVNFDIYCVATTMFENWIDKQLQSNPKDLELKLQSLKLSL
jgi:hypothetical protein